MTATIGSRFEATRARPSLRAVGALLFALTACGGPADPEPTPQPDPTPEQKPTCVADDESGGCLASVRLTYLSVDYDLKRPVYVNNRVPVEFGLTATSPDAAAPATRDVAVSFSFVEADAAPQDAIECASSSAVVSLVGDGKERVFKGFIWPTSLCTALADKVVNLRVSFDGGEEAETGIDYPPVSFTAANRGAELNQACRSVADPAAAELGRGCVYDIDIEPTPTDGTSTLIDIRYAGLEPASSVAVLPHVETPEAELAPSLVVESSLVVNGRDPYIAGLAPEDVPAELEERAPGITRDLQFGVDPAELGKLTAMPGRATLRFELVPAGDDSGWLPLRVGSPGAKGGRDDEAVIENLLPGTSNAFAHELFAEGPTREALDEGGQWADVTDFTVRGCFAADFEQKGNDGEGDASDCRTIPVVLVRERPNPSSATSIGFNGELTRELGNPSRLGLAARLSTTNRLDRGGASSRVEGEVEIEGKLGKSFSVTVARAVGLANLGVSSGETGYEIQVDAFNKRIYSVSKSDPSVEHEDDFSAAKSFSFPGLGFGFGPVRVGFKFRLGGEVSFTTSDQLSLLTDGAECSTLLGSANAFGRCGSMSRAATPGFSFTAAVEGGIDIRIARASVVANLNLVNTDFPLTASLAWGLGGDGKLTVLGKAKWELGMQLIRGDVSIVGRVGIRRFSKTLKVHLFSFSSQRFTRTLLDRSMNVFEVLE